MLKNSKDFSVRLKKIKAEVLAYKQFQKSGAGRADFYRYKFPFNLTPPGQYLIAKFYFNTSEQPMFKLYSSFSNKTVNWNDGVLTIKDNAALIGGEIIVIANTPYEVEVEYADE